MAEIISLREFSRRVGVSDTTVRNNKDKLKPALCELDNGRPAIDWGVGYQIWLTLPVGEKQKTGSISNNNDVKYQNISSSNSVNESDVESSAPELVQAAKARSAKSVFEAKLKQLEYQEKSGKLVDKDTVYKKLFDAGRNLRLALQALPDRVIDNILASGNRNEARHYLLQEINKVLLNLDGNVETVLNDFD